MTRHSPRSQTFVFPSLWRFALAWTMLVALTWSSAASGGDVQHAPQPSQDAGNNGSSQEKSAAPSAAGSGTLYLYRPGRVLGKVTHFSAYVGDTFLAEIHNGEFASTQVPAGQVLITTALSVTGKYRMPFAGPWASDAGCAGLKWRRLVLEPRANIGHCMDDLRVLAQKCGAWAEHSGGGGVIITTIHTPACNYQLRGSSLAYELLEKVHSAIRLNLNIESGKTYYVRWNFYSVEVVDETKGAKEIKKVKPAKETDEGDPGQITPPVANP